MTSEIPGEDSQRFQPQPPPSTYSSGHGAPPSGYGTSPGGYGASTQTLPPQQSKTPKQMNIVGLIALIAGVLGFIFACVPGALIVGWILLPVAFIMGIVSLFLKDKSKWMGITAVILSVLGTIVGAIVFFTVVADSIDESFGSGDTTVVQPSDEPAADGVVPGPEASEDEPAGEGPASGEGTRADPYPIGSVIETDEWRVVVNSVTLAATDAVLAESEYNDVPAAGSEYIIVNYSATYLGDDPNGQSPSIVQVEYVTAEGTTVSTYDSFATIPEPIDASGALYTDATATGNASFTVPSATAAEGVLAIRPDFIADKVFVAVQ